MNKLIHIADITKEKAYTGGYRPFVALADKGGARTLLLVPMLKDGDLVGAIAIYRAEVRPFARQTDRAGAELRRPGGNRHREHATAQRAAPAHRRSQRVSSTANRHRRRAESHQPLDLRPADRLRHAGRSRRHGCARPTMPGCSKRRAGHSVSRPVMAMGPKSTLESGIISRPTMSRRTEAASRGEPFSKPE